MEISIKNSEEITLMRKSGKILASVLSNLISAAKPGVTTLALDQMAETMIREADALPAFKGYKGFPGTLCTPINNQVVHTIPSSRILKDGDILTMDLGVNYKGLLTDAAVTIPIGKVSRETHEFIDTVRNILIESIKLIKPGIRIGEISHYIGTEISKAKYHVIKELIGHGIGRHLHEAPQVPNYGNRYEGAALKPGMTFCIEPIIGYSTRLIDTLNDGWCIVTRDGGLACQQEHCILVTETGYEILTQMEEETI